jgi:hypothetical protein
VNAVPALEPGDPQQVGRYRLLSALGGGGMGRVYLGQSPGGRLVAVKLIRSDLASDPDFRIRFAREVATARTVSGIFTAPVVDADTDAPQPWLVTAYVEGPSLADAVAERGPLPVSSLRPLAAGLAEGLGAIHTAGVVHRDLKPSNVLLASDGPRIIDFGISRSTGATALTRVGWVTGSPGFMSPEQAMGEEARPASDVFSLGALLAFAATGRDPFGAGSVNEQLYRIVHSAPVTDAVPAPVRPLIDRCLAKDPRQRPTTDQILADLGTVHPAANWLQPLSGPTQTARAAQAAPPPGRAPREPELPAPAEFAAAPPAAVAGPEAGQAPDYGWTTRPDPGRGGGLNNADLAGAGLAGEGLAGEGSGGTGAAAGADPHGAGREGAGREGAGWTGSGRPGAEAENGASYQAAGHQGAGYQGAGHQGARGQRSRAGHQRGRTGRRAAARPQPGISRRSLAGGLGVLAVVLVVGVVFLVLRPGPAKSGQATPSGRTSASPAGLTGVIYRDPSGFSITLPHGWSKTSRSSGEVTFSGPQTGFVIVVAWTKHPQGRQLTAWQQQAAYKSQTDKSYREIRIQQVSYRGYDAADWEFINLYQGQRTKVIDHGFIVRPGQLAYAIEFFGPVSRWQPVYSAAWPGLLDSFKPAA